MRTRSLDAVVDLKAGHSHDPTLIRSLQMNTQLLAIEAITLHVAESQETKFAFIV